jgi:hypothetical protein
MQQLAEQLAPLVPESSALELGAMLASLDERLGTHDGQLPGSPLVQLLLRVSERLDKDAPSLSHPAVKLDEALSSPEAQFRRFARPDDRVLGLFTYAPLWRPDEPRPAWPEWLRDEGQARVCAELAQLGIARGPPAAFSHVWVRNLRPMRLPGGDVRGYLLAFFDTEGFQELTEEEEELGEAEDPSLVFNTTLLLAVPEDAALPARLVQERECHVHVNGLLERTVELDEDGGPLETTVVCTPHPADGQDLFFEAWFGAAARAFAAE